MKTKILTPGDKVKLKTKTKDWTGLALKSHDPEVILLKLESGYNIGIRENEILDVKLIKKAESSERAPNKFASKASLTSGGRVGASEQETNKDLPNIALIITGGTISARLDPTTGGVTWTDAEEILTLAPEISKICNIIKIEKPFMKASEDMSFRDYKKLAQLSEKLLNQENISGIIITHGTDFLHYTASALAFFLGKLNKPVALTYSQRSIDRGSTDAALNLLCSAKYAISDIAEVALIGHKNLDDEICLAMPATKTRKMHTSRRDTFKVINDEPIAEISSTNFKILKHFNARSNKKLKSDIKFSEQTTLIKIHPGQDPDILNYYAEKQYKGIILELSGLGHAPGKASIKNWLPTIKKLSSKITIAGVAQTINGELNPNVYSAGRDSQKTGIIFLKDMLPETALIKLSWILGHSSWAKDKNKIKQKLLENVAGEFNECLGIN